MPKKTLALISVLVLVTVVLFVIALRSGQNQSQQGGPTPVAEAPTPTPAAHSVLTLSPNPVTVPIGGQGSVDVLIDTSINAVTAVQLELAYDPKTVSNVKVVTSDLFPNAAVLIDKNNAQTGQYTYAFGITPGRPTVNGTGKVATITFTGRGTNGTQSQLTLLPTTLVTASGVPTSVLKSSTGTTVIIGGTAVSAPVQSSPSAGL